MLATVFALVLGQRDLQKLPSDDFDRAAQLWKTFKMPVPSSTATPVMVTIDDQAGKGFAFLDGTLGDLACLDAGTRRISGKRVDFQIDQLNWKDKIVLPISHNYSHLGFPENTAAAGAIQGVLLGHREFAKSMFDANKTSFFSYFFEDRIAATVDDSLTAQCALLILTHIVNDFLTPGSDAKAALQKLTQLNTYHLLKRSQQYPWWGPNEIIKALRETASISPAKAGSAQGAVDRLTEITRDPSKYWNYFSIQETAQYLNVLSFGLDAVKPLANELDRNRLTRLYEPTSGNSPLELYPVRLVADSLIIKLANGDLGTGRNLGKSQVLSWLKDKRSNSVEKWLLNRITKPGYHRLECNDQIWEAIVHTHPNLLNEALRRIHDKDIGQTYALYWIDNSTLPKSEKHDLIVFATDTHFIVPAREGLEFLRKYDRAGFDRLLLRILDQCPNYLDEDYADLSRWVVTTKNEQVWQKFEKVIHSVDVTMRSCLLKTLGRGYSTADGELYLAKGIPILRQYFDDNSRIKDFKRHDILLRLSVVGGLDKEAPTVGSIALQAAAAAAGIIPYDGSDISSQRWKEIRKQIEGMDNKGKGSQPQLNPKR